MLLTTELRWCGECAAHVVFDRFDCTDHAADCLELVCTGCGAGLELLDPLNAQLAEEAAEAEGAREVAA